MGKKKYKYITISSEERLALAIGADVLTQVSKGYTDIPLDECKKITDIINNLLDRSKHEDHGTK